MYQALQHMDNLRMYVYLRHGGRVFRAEDVAGLSTYPIPVRDATAYGCVQVTVRDIRPASLTQVVDFCYVRRTVFAWAQLVPPRVRRVTIEHARVELPADIAAALVCTDALAIRECRLRAFPFRDLPAHMRTLDVSRNEISGRIDLSHTTLRFVYVSQNKIAELELPYDCNTVDASHNQLRDIHLHNPTMYADVSHNAIEHIVVSKWIEVLDASHNVLGAIDLARCAKLQKLDVSRNRLVGTLDLSACGGCKHVHAAHNRIEWIEGVDTMTALEVIDASHNRMQAAVVPQNATRASFAHNPLEVWEWMRVPTSRGGMLSTVGNMLFSRLVPGGFERDTPVSATTTHTIDVSYTHCSEFPYILDTDEHERVRVIFHGNRPVPIEFHPNVVVHVRPQDVAAWERHVPNFGVLVERKFLCIDDDNDT